MVQLQSSAPVRERPLCTVELTIELRRYGVYEVEFSDDAGRAYAFLALRSDQLMRLRHEPDHRAA
jgi:hypothetical protein